MLGWFGDNSLPLLDARAADRLISRHGPSALLRDVVPEWSAWVEVGLGWTNAAWPAEAEDSPALQTERAAIIAAMQAWRLATGGHWLCRMCEAAEAAEEWARWWDVPRRRREALKTLLDLLEELPDEATRRFGGRHDPKLTDAVAAAAKKIGGALHGGDGNSGECQHAAETISIKPDGPPPGSDSQEAPGGVSPDATDEVCAAGQTACSALEDAESEPTAEPGEGDRGANNPTADAEEPRPDRSADAEPAQGAAATETGAGDQPDRDGRVAPQSGAASDGWQTDAIGTEREGGDTASDKTDAERPALDSAPEDVTNSGLPKGNDDASTRSAPGGWYASPEAASRRALSLSGPARDVARALRRLVKAEQVGLGEPSPRISARRLVRELAGKSFRLGRAHRDELEPGRVIVAPDQSGSCSACADETLAAALALAREMPDVVEVVPTSNGHRDDGRSWDWRGVKLLLIFGDWDGGEIYRQAASEGVKIVWLDSFGKAGGVRPSRDHARGAFNHWPRENRPIKFDGVGTAADAAVALRAALRGHGIQ